MNDKTYHLCGNESADIISAIANRQRFRILELLSNGRMSVQDLIEELQLGRTTVLSHINKLEKAGFIRSYYSTGTKGGKRICEVIYEEVKITLNINKTESRQVAEIEPGNYFDFKVDIPCGLGSKSGIIGQWDTVGAFYNSNRVYASLVWTSKGYLQYKIPINNDIKIDEITELDISLEIASIKNIIVPHLDQSNQDLSRITPGKTEVSFSINTIKVGQVMLKSSEEHCKGTYTPSWWNGLKSGELVNIKVSNGGTWVNNNKVTRVGLREVIKEHSLEIRIAIDDSAIFQSGFIIFGKDFGNYSQGIKVKIK